MEEYLPLHLSRYGINNPELDEDLSSWFDDHYKLTTQSQSHDCEEYSCKYWVSDCVRESRDVYECVGDGVFKIYQRKFYDFVNKFGEICEEELGIDCTEFLSRIDDLRSCKKDLAREIDEIYKNLVFFIDNIRYEPYETMKIFPYKNEFLTLEHAHMMITHIARMLVEYAEHR